MAKDRESIVMNGKPAFYACILDDLKNAALQCGWALGLHGSLASDMDIMAMPWTEDAKPVEEMIQALSDCFSNNPFKELHTIPHYGKPNNRVVYTIAIWKDFYLDINIINSAPSTVDVGCGQKISKQWIPEGLYTGMFDTEGTPIYTANKVTLNGCKATEAFVGVTAGNNCLLYAIFFGTENSSVQWFLTPELIRDKKIRVIQ